MSHLNSGFDADEALARLRGLVAEWAAAAGGLDEDWQADIAETLHTLDQYMSLPMAPLPRAWCSDTADMPPPLPWEIDLGRYGAEPSRPVEDVPTGGLL